MHRTMRVCLPRKGTECRAVPQVFPLPPSAQFHAWMVCCFRAEVMEMQEWENIIFVGRTDKEPVFQDDFLVFNYSEAEPGPGESLTQYLQRQLAARVCMLQG